MFLKINKNKWHNKIVEKKIFKLIYNGYDNFIYVKWILKIHFTLFHFMHNYKKYIFNPW